MGVSAPSLHRESTDSDGAYPGAYGLRKRGLIHVQPLRTIHVLESLPEAVYVYLTV